MSDSTDTVTQQQEQTFAAIQKPHMAENEDQLLVLWGRFWSDSANKAGAFYVQFNIDQTDISILRVLLYDDDSQLEDYDPDQSPHEYKQSLPEDPTTGTNTPQADLKIFDQTVRKVLNDREGIQSLKSVLSDKNRSEFSDWTYDFLSNFVTKGNLTYQVKGQLTTRDIMSRNESRATPDADQEPQDTEDAEEDRNYRPVSITTSPMNGHFPSDLPPEEEVFVRATGPIVDKLPDDMVDERYDHMSAQLESTVTSTEQQPALPDDFDGDPKDYWNVRVSFLDDKYGEGFVHKDEQVKLVNTEPDDSDDSRWIVSPGILIATGLALLGIVGLAYLIFG